MEPTRSGLPAHSLPTIGHQAGEKDQLSKVLLLSHFMSNSVRPQRRQPTRVPHPWDSPGKNTAVGCHFLLQCMKLKREREVAQLCLTPSDPMDCSPPGSSIHGIFQARVLEWDAIAFKTKHKAGPCLAGAWLVTGFFSEGPFRGGDIQSGLGESKAVLVRVTTFLLGVCCASHLSLFFPDTCSFSSHGNPTR